MIEMLAKEGLLGESMLHFNYLAKIAGDRFRKTGDASLVMVGLKTWLTLAGFSKTQSNMVLKMLWADMSLKSSVM